METSEEDYDKMMMMCVSRIVFIVVCSEQLPWCFHRAVVEGQTKTRPATETENTNC